MNTPLKSAQRRYDNELPPDEPPEPRHAMELLARATPCPCEAGNLTTDSLIFHVGSDTEEGKCILVKCHKCEREGPERLYASDAVDAWDEALKEEE